MPRDKILTLLPTLPYFMSVVEHGMSFTKAASDMNITQGAVSQRIKQLEDELGLSLFLRHPRRLTLTKEGQLLYDIASSRLGMLRREIGHIDQIHDYGILTVHCSPSFGGMWLTPRLESFYEQCPEISLHLRCRNDLIDMETEDIDIAVLYCTKAYTGTDSIILLDEWLLPVCSPEYARRKRLHELGRAALKNCLFLHDNIVWHNSQLFSEWEYWAKESGMGDIRMDNSYSFDRMELTIAAAKNGLGIALGRKNLVQADIQANALVTPFDHMVKAKQSYMAIFRKENALSPRIRLFLDWLTNQAARARESMPWDNRGQTTINSKI
ncbi:MAG: LysR family transcriptional regulator [Candidatus Accumulibacter sp.]|jgi:LysR family D-serine deaminase transcriptional activator|nr:LysR family transcriptional regulator [Accumulibacter sp.]